MAFTIDGIVIDRIQMGIAEDFSGNILYTLTQLKDATITISSESKDAVDANGTLIKRFYTGKTGEFSSTNAFVDFNIMAAGTGSPKEVATASAKITMPGIRIIKKGNAATVTLPGVLADTVTVVGMAGNGTKVADYTKDTAAADATFSITGETLTLPTKPADEVVDFVVKYNREVSSGVKVVNRADKFPGTIKLTLKALAVDPCSADQVRACYIVLPSFQVSPDVELSLNTDAGIAYSGVLQSAFCDGNKTLYEIYFAEDDVEE